MLIQQEANSTLLELENSNAYSNFVKSMNSEQTRHIYEYTLSQYLKHYQTVILDFHKEAGKAQKIIYNQMAGARQKQKALTESEQKALTESEQKALTESEQKAESESSQ